MKTFTEPLKELKEFETLSAGVHDLRGIAQISGCIDAAKPHIMYSVNNGSGNRIIVTFQEQRAKEIYEEYRFFDPKAAYYPAKDRTCSKPSISSCKTSRRANGAARTTG